jgi:Raf kinase inhibitor-like YbhB/YbcL family protein
MLLSSDAYDAGEAIPRRHTCEGENVSPPFAWRGVPSDTKSLVLIMKDPDAPDPVAPERTFAHWLLYDLPPESVGVPEGVTARALPQGARTGRNDFGKTAYGGPCPPIGRHRCFTRLYALDVELRLEEPTLGELEAALEGHVLAMAEHMGTYEKTETE